jgi:hypothetical protein
MIPKSGYRFSEKIMLKEQAKAKWRFNLIPFRFSRTRSSCLCGKYFLQLLLWPWQAPSLRAWRHRAPPVLSGLHWRPIGAASRSRVMTLTALAGQQSDGTITLQLRSLWPNPIAEGQLVYAPDDPQYEEIKHHLGGIKPGESKPVPPFCGLNSEP